jgi:CRISPR system Cascade subunit CasD
MTVLVLRLAGPMQAWGSPQQLNKFRRTERYPTKSAVIGLLAAALGRSRYDSVDDLTQLRFGVRVDRPGQMLIDYHTVSSLFDAKRNYNPSGGQLPNKKGYRSPQTSTQVTERYYLSDACFVAGMEWEDRALLDILNNALHYPIFPLYLGRRSCPPDRPVWLGVFEDSLEKVLVEMIPWQACPWQAKEDNEDNSVNRKPVSCELIIEDIDGDTQIIDNVKSFDPYHRSYTKRWIKFIPEVMVPMSNDVSGLSRDIVVQDDPFLLLEDD